MTKITYLNNYGAVTFGESPVKILEIDGLTLPQKQFSTFLYSDGSGQTTIGEATLARHITLTADIYLKDGVTELSRMLKILNTEGTLEVSTAFRKRRIAAYLNSFNLNERHGKYQSFTVQFTCDYPYFSDAVDRCEGIYCRENAVSDSFTLPCIFTKRSSKAEVLLGGEMPCDPVLKIKCIRDYESDGSGISVINHRNGNCFKLNYSPKKGDEITVDFHKRTVINALGESLINFISEDTFLSEFKLETGENEIEVLNNEDAEGISVIIEYQNIYAEAVI